MSSYSRLLLLSACLLTLTLIPPSRADEPPARLPAVTITAQVDPLTPRFTSNSVTDLSHDDLTVAHERSLYDVLPGTPGLTLTGGNGYGKIGNLILRGAEGQGLVYLDGIPLLSALTSFGNLDTLPPEALEKLELIRGPSSAYQPFQALGGTLRLSSRTLERSAANLHLEGGSFGILRENLQGGLAGEHGRLTLTASRGDAFDGIHDAGVYNGNGERDPFRFTQGLMRFATQPTTDLQWEGSLLYRQSHVGADRLGMDALGRMIWTDDRHGFLEEETWLGQNAATWKIAPDWESRLQLGFTQNRVNVKTGPFFLGFSDRLLLANWRNTHALWQDPGRQAQVRLIWGGEGRHETAQAPMLQFADERHMEAGFLEVQGQWGRWSGETGLRVERYERYGEHPLFHAGLALQALDTVKIRLKGGTGYRIPGYNDLLFPFFGNLQLKPERSAGGELGAEWQPITSLRISATGYYQRYDNLILLHYDPHRMLALDNVADAEVSGAEVSLDYAWNEALSSGVTYTHTSSENWATGKDLPYRPRHSGRLWGRWSPPDSPWSLWGELLYRGQGWNDLANTLAVGEAVHLNAQLAYRYSPKLELYLRGENLNDNKTPQIFSFDQPGIAVYGGFNWQL